MFFFIYTKKNEKKNERKMIVLHSISNYYLKIYTIMKTNEQKKNKQYYLQLKSREYDPFRIKNEKKNKLTNITTLFDKIVVQRSLGQYSVVYGYLFPFKTMFRQINNNLYIKNNLFQIIHEKKKNNFKKMISVDINLAKIFMNKKITNINIIKLILSFIYVSCNVPDCNLMTDTTYTCLCLKSYCRIHYYMYLKENINYYCCSICLSKYKLINNLEDCVIPNCQCELCFGTTKYISSNLDDINSYFKTIDKKCIKNKCYEYAEYGYRDIICYCKPHAPKLSKKYVICKCGVSRTTSRNLCNFCDILK